MSVPLLFTKTGIIESEPFGFYETLAASYAADRHNSDEVRLELGHDRPIFNARMSRMVNETMLERTIGSLQDGRSVVYDGFLNTRERRGQVREAVRGLGRVGIVSLSLHAPMAVVDARIRERFANDELSLEKRFYEDADQVVHVAKRMLRGVEWPNRAQGEPTLHLDGTLPMDSLLDKIARHLRQRRLR